MREFMRIIDAACLVYCCYMFITSIDPIDRAFAVGLGLWCFSDLIRRR